MRLEQDGVTWFYTAEVSGEPGDYRVTVSDIVGVDLEGNHVEPWPDLEIDLAAHAIKEIDVSSRGR